HTLFRKLSTTQGRWMTPDPSGMAAVDFTNPQSLNMYAYLGNYPSGAVDPLVLVLPPGTCTPSTCAAPPQNDDLAFKGGHNFGCTIEGVPADCGLAGSLVDSGSAIICGIYVPGTAKRG